MEKLNNKGFVFIETIVTIVILTTTLLLLYKSYSGTVKAEKTRLYYDDISYMYKAVAVRNVLNSTIDPFLFKQNAISKVDRQYMYMFGPSSNIYYDNEIISNLFDTFHIKTFIYIPIDSTTNNLNNIKNCIKNKNYNPKCIETLEMLSSYGESNLIDYLKTINVDSSELSSSPGILVTLFYETKNGGEQNKISYSSCLQSMLAAKYGINPSNKEEIKRKVEEYYQDDTISINMWCENAYYISWVYL